MIELTDLSLLALVGLLGFGCQWLAVKLKLPAILFLLSVGLLLGPVAHIFDPDEVFGGLLFPYISLSVAIILFEGALTLSKRELTHIGRPVLNMVTWGILINASITTLAAHYIIGLSWAVSALFGAIMVVTGPTVVIPMLRAIRPQPKIGDALRWEGIVIDPIGALFAVLVYEFIVVSHSPLGLGEVVSVFLETVITGVMVGIIVGYTLGLLLRHHRIPESLQNFASLVIVCSAFAVSDAIMHESGLLAVTLMGIILANMEGVKIRSILGFKEDLTLVLVSVLFIVLAARVDFAGIVSVGWGALFLLLILQFVARPAKVFASFIGSNFTFRERAMVAWVGPRGIVAAAISAVFSLRLEELGVEGSELLVPLAFVVIIGTVVIQSLTARPIAVWLKVVQAKSEGVVIIGATTFSTAFASTLNQLEVPVLICDTNWDKLRAARTAGLPTYYGNPSSEHAENHLNFATFGMMLGLSDHHEYNLAQAIKFKDEFGERSIFRLPAHHSKGSEHKHIATDEFGGTKVFDEGLDALELKHLLAQGSLIKITRITEDYDMEKWQAANLKSAPLCKVEPAGKIVFFEPGKEVLVEPLDQLIYLTDRYE